VFFVDTSKQSQGKESKAVDWYQKNVGGPAQLLRLKRWRGKILGHLPEEMKEGFVPAEERIKREKEALDTAEIEESNQEQKDIIEEKDLAA
jgi:hypothetical protein